MSLLAEIEIALINARSVIPHYPQVATRQHELYERADLLRDPDFADPYDEALQDLGKLIAAARAACREIKSLKRHVHYGRA